jgi:hypothetical protein
MDNFILTSWKTALFDKKIVRQLFKKSTDPAMELASDRNAYHEENNSQVCMFLDYRCVKTV